MTMTATQATRPQIAHSRCTRLKCSTSRQRVLRHAHSLPLAPSTKIITTFTSGTNISNAM